MIKHNFWQPLHLTYDLDLYSQPILGQSRPHAKYQGPRSNTQSAHSDKQMNGRTLPRTLSPQC